MMETKLFEIRDRGTFIPALAIRLCSHTEEERYLLSRAGYGKNSQDHEDYVLLAKIDGGELKINYDVYNWHGNRTMQVAHNHIKHFWDDVKSGDVIDVEFLSKETAAPKQSERLTAKQYDI